ncbi:MAG: hypothetical protein KF805_00290 [Phycisphaeraceae bacterium]|nr:hypothetical protein [Phycisphaeraceae bacterium]
MKNLSTNTGTQLITLVLTLGSAGIFAGCQTGPGKCVGTADTSTRDGKVLLNVDSDGVAIQGYDPVAYFTDSKPIKGDPAIRSEFGGAEYYFASTDHKRMFDAAPAKYAPQFGGYCAYAASIDTISPIDPTYWEIVDGRLLLQHNKKAWDLWHKDGSGNLVKADRNWPGIVERDGSAARALLNVDANGLALEGFDPVSYFTDPKPVRGDVALARTYGGATYLFANPDHKDQFEKEPSRYVPAFGGFCGYAASINKISTINPEIYQVIDGKLVLQHTPEAYRLFNQDTAANFEKAEQNWPGLAHRRCN